MVIFATLVSVMVISFVNTKFYHMHVYDELLFYLEYLFLFFNCVSPCNIFGKYELYNSFRGIHKLAWLS